MEEKVTHVLESIGLSKNEISIYLDLATHRPSSALEISSRTKIHRSNTYDSIRKLIERGFASEIIQENKRLFNALPPEKIKDYLKQQQQEFEAIIPQLKIFAQNTEEENVSISKGVFSVRESLLNLLEQKQPISVYGASRASFETLGLGFLKDFHQQRIKSKVLMRHIYNPDASDRVKLLNRMKLTEARCFAKKYFSIVSTNICRRHSLTHNLQQPGFLNKNQESGNRRGIQSLF